MSEGVVIRSFAAGELAPSLTTRADLAKYTIGLRTCRNFLVQRHGGVSNRPGTRLIEEAKTTSASVKLVPYVSEIEGESILIEHGVGYFRFYQGDAQVGIGAATAYGGATAYTYGDVVSSGGVNYYCRAPTTGNAPPNATFWYAMPAGILELPSPFSDPRGTHSEQSGRLIAFAHPSVRPHDLIFVSLTQWVLRPVITTPKVSAPTGVMLTAGAGTRSFGYIVTAVHPDTYEESLSSAQVINAACLAPTEAAPHALTWTAVLTPASTGVASPQYYVYCDPYGNGTYGFIGTATGAALFNNPGITPDFTQTPQLALDLFNATNEYPSTPGFYQQRRLYANTNDIPDLIDGSRVGHLDNFGISTPLQDDDAISFRIAGNNAHAVRWLIGLKRLIAMTDGGEWAIGRILEPLTPNDIQADQETYVGVSRTVRPVVVGNSILYVQARNRIVRELRFDQDVEGFAGRDLTIYAAHLFKRRTIVAQAYQQTPDSILWCVRSDGALVALTYIHAEDVVGWHRHDTIRGDFEDVCALPAADRDVVYFVVERDGHRYIEKLEDREIETWNTDAFFVDSGLSYAGAPVSAVGGLTHLANTTVRVVGDGQDLGTFTVSGAGVVTLSAAYSDIHVGLPITAELSTLDLDIAGSSIRDKTKRVSSATVVVEESSRAFEIGYDATKLVRYIPKPTESPATVSFTGNIEVNVFAKWTDHGRVYIRHQAPLPLTVLGITPNVEIGG
jgi:hypothetical protein